MTVRIPLVSQTLPAPTDRRRIILSEVLSMLVVAGIFVTSAEDYQFGVAWWLFILVLRVGTVLMARPLPKDVKSFVNQKAMAFAALLIAWWWIRFGRFSQLAEGLRGGFELNGPSPEVSGFSDWAVPLVAFVYSGFTMAWIHRVSEVRRFWRKGARIWLWLVLPVEAGVLLTLGSAVLESRAVSNSQILLWLILGVVLPYLVSRQRRTQGATR